MVYNGNMENPFRRRKKPKQEASRHGVRFGRVAVSTERHAPITTFVAVKPYDKRRVDLGMKPASAVVHDWATNEHLSRLSSGTAYETAGIWRNGDTFFVPQLLTRYNERSTSLDNYFRADPARGDRVSPELIAQAMKLGHFGLGLAHGARITHGDAFPQNFATDGSRIIFNDTTTLRPFGKEAGSTLRKLDEDVQDFVDGMIHPDASSQHTRRLSVELLKNPAQAAILYDKYLAGARLGRERAGLAESRLIVPEDAHKRMLDTVIQKYAHR